MWKKEDVPPQASGPQPDATPRPQRSTPTGTPSERATIGRSISIRGDVTGDEDLMIQGRIDGSVHLQQHSVTVGPDGDVKASVTGRVVTVEGRVEGNINADEQVILRSSAFVQGDISAPRVVLEDGARFRGGVDMGDAGEGSQSTANSAFAQSRKGSESDRTATEADKSASEVRKSVPEPIGASIEKAKGATDTGAGARM